MRDESSYGYLAVAVLFVVLGIVVFDGPVPRVAMVVAGLLFAWQALRERG